MAANIRLRYKWMGVTNTLAYSAAVLITVVESFVIQAPGDNNSNYFPIGENIIVRPISMD